VPTFESKYRKQAHAKKDGIDSAHKFLLEKPAPGTINGNTILPKSGVGWVERMQPPKLNPAKVEAKPIEVIATCDGFRKGSTRPAMWRFALADITDGFFDLRRAGHGGYA
jgi:hypothetical protein